MPAGIAPTKTLPKREGLALLSSGLFGGKGVQLVKIQQNYRQNRAKLDDGGERTDEVRGKLQVQKFVHQKQMPGAADGQPFGNALHNAQKDCF